MRLDEPGGWGSAAPQTWTKPLFFGQKPNFSRRSHQPKMKKIVFIKRKNGIHSVYSTTTTTNLFSAT